MNDNFEKSKELRRKTGTSTTKFTAQSCSHARKKHQVRKMITISLSSNLWTISTTNCRSLKSAGKRQENINRISDIHINIYIYIYINIYI